MKTITDLFSSSVVQSLGWTLLHSVWQALLIFLIVVLLHRVVKTSSMRYAISLAGLAIVFLLSLSTFTYLQSQSTSRVSVPAATTFIRNSSTSFLADQSEVLNVTHLLQSNMDVIVIGWIIGTILFSLRVVSGGIYVSVLRKNSSIILTHWSTRTDELAKQLLIKRIVTLAESAKVHAPIVLGYLKPLIILPTGMLSGLSAEQVEMILMHELMHIKRHDYLINIAQMIMESIFFFNPFVWILSEVIRKEREHCCDDAVVHYYANATAYAHALAQLEEVRISRIEPALGLAQNKNQLLNRIKRIMENSVKNYSARNRVVPAVLLIVGLICASWLTISKEMNTELEKPASDKVLTSQDTSIDGRSNKGSYSRTTVVTTDEHDEPLEEIIERYEGDEDLIPFIEVPEFEMAEVPDFNIDMIPPIPDFIFESDTIPEPGFYFSLRDYEKFSEQFETKFKEQFGCQQKIQPLKDVEKNLDYELHNEVLAEVENNINQINTLIGNQINQELEKNMALHARVMVEHEKVLAKMNADVARFKAEQNIALKEVEKNLQHMEENLKKFEKKLQVELVKDGYLKAGEEVKNIHWNTEGDIEINGKKIKQEHRKKYNKLHDQFFQEKDLILEED